MALIQLGLSECFQPWGQTAVYKRLIAENEQRRQQRFDEARKRCEGLDSTTRDEILRLSFLELRGVEYHRHLLTTSLERRLI